jgi:D-glycero-D-manno-heptose 1,7-bisphosphate phosphatase
VAVKAVFMDKDGTLVENVPYNADPARIRLAPGAEDAVARLSRSGYRVIVVSNQPGVALGLFSESDLRQVENHLREALPALDGFYCCPHAPEQGCECRKPASGLLVAAAREQGVDLGESWMVGDILDDVEAGRRAGCRTVLVDVGNETEWNLNEQRRPHVMVPGLAEAAEAICGAT